MKTWIVTTDYVHGVLTYFVENRITGERRGQSGCATWAEEYARQLNMGEDNAKMFNKRL